MLKGMPADLHLSDEYLIHQMSGSINRVETPDPAWFDRLIFEAFDEQHTMYLAAGMGTYPNVNVSDGFATVVRGTTQQVVRVARRTHSDRDRSSVGPLSFTPEKPMQSWALAMADNEHGVSFDLKADARFAPVRIRDVSYSRLGGGQDLVWSHYFQICRYKGMVTVGGETIPFDGFGARDRSWGERRLFGGEFGLYLWLHMSFAHHGVEVFYQERADGSPFYCDGAVITDDGEHKRITELRHRLELQPGTVRHVSGQLLLVHPDGSETELGTRRVFQGPSLIGAGYSWRQGFDLGESHMEGDRWDVNAHDQLTKNVDTTDQIVEFSDGKERTHGVFELAKISAQYTYKPTM